LRKATKKFGVHEFFPQTPRIISGQSLDSNELVFRRQMRVTDSHWDALVAHPFGDRADVHIGHREPR
jgi:hypothetical protein